jgi:hypothetical protein
MAQKLQPRDIEALFSELREIKDPRLRDAVAEIWCETAAEMKWDTLEEIPKNTEEERGRSLIGHVKGVTAMALAICEAAKTLHGKEYDKDAMIAASLLHVGMRACRHQCSECLDALSHGVLVRMHRSALATPHPRPPQDVALASEVTLVRRVPWLRWLNGKTYTGTVQADGTGCARKNQFSVPFRVECRASRLRHVPDGRGPCTDGIVSGNLAIDRRTSTKTA